MPDEYRVSRDVYEARGGDVLRLYVRHGDQTRTHTAEIYEAIERQSDIRELRGWVEERTPEELVVQVQHCPGISTNPDYHYALRPLPWYEDREVYIEYGPDGARIALYIDGVTEASVQ